MPSKSAEDSENVEGNFTPATPAPAHTYAIPHRNNSIWRNIYLVINYTPKRCRYNPDEPFGFSMSLNLLFGFAATFTVANLYYSHPILNKLADDFHVDQERVSLIPTLAQAGYAGGLLFLCPLGDLFRRRAFVILLVWFTATVWWVAYAAMDAFVPIDRFRWQCDVQDWPLHHKFIRTLLFSLFLNGLDDSDPATQYANSQTCN